MTSNYDAWLEAPYQRRAEREEAIERVEEDLWNGGGTLVPRSLATAVEEVFDYLPAKLADQFIALVGGLAEHLIEVAEEEGS